MSHGLQRLQLDFGVVPTGILHVGASDGGELDTYLRCGARPIVLVEALDEPFRVLQSRASGHDGVLAVQACVSDVEARRVCFNVASNGGRSSSYLRPTGHTSAVPHVEFKSTIDLVTTTLDHVLGEVAGRGGFDPATVDYLGMDTQGTELDVLRGAHETLSHINFVFTEVSFGSLYAGSASLYELIEFLRPRGFDLYWCEIRALGWGDALFVRREWIERNGLRLRKATEAGAIGKRAWQKALRPPNPLRSILRRAKRGFLASGKRDQRGH